MKRIIVRIKDGKVFWKQMVTMVPNVSLGVECLLNSWAPSNR